MGGVAAWRAAGSWSGDRAAAVWRLPVRRRVCRAAAVSPLGDFGWRVMRGHLPGGEPETGMPRPGNGCGGSVNRLAKDASGTGGGRHVRVR